MRPARSSSSRRRWWRCGSAHHILRWYGYDEETDQRVDPDDFAAYRDGPRRAYIWVGGRKQFFPIPERP
ncbi:MAG TPA: hypothetical protein VMY80_05480 [Anaerolineae bacterium]|nr:hypothetical protein [Anaerolineae bacterium]